MKKNQFSKIKTLKQNECLPNALFSYGPNTRKSIAETNIPCIKKTTLDVRILGGMR